MGPGSKADKLVAIFQFSDTKGELYRMELNPRSEKASLLQPSEYTKVCIIGFKNQDQEIDLTLAYRLRKRLF